MKLKWAFFIMIIFLAYRGDAQQPWVQKPLKGYAQLGFTFFNYSKVHDTPTNTGLSIARPITQIIASTYLELGLFKRCMLSAEIPMQLAASGGVKKDWPLPTLDKNVIFGAGNISTKLTFSLVEKGGFTLSAYYNSIFNSAIYDGFSGLQTGYRAMGFEPGLAAGLGLKKHFFALSVAPTFRNNNYSHQLKIDGKWGSRMGKRKRGWFIVSLNNLLILNKKSAGENFAIDLSASETYMYLNEQAFIGFSLTWGLELEKWSGWLSFAGGPAWSAGRGVPLSFSIGRKLNFKKDTKVNEED